MAAARRTRDVGRLGDARAGALGIGRLPPAQPRLEVVIVIVVIALDLVP